LVSALLCKLLPLELVSQLLLNRLPMPLLSMFMPLLLELLVPPLLVP
jgi:hypothetical protein